MIWCDMCQRKRETDTDQSTGSLCCSVCGKVLISDLFSTDVTFIKTPSGSTRTDSTTVRSVGKDNQNSQSYKRAAYLINNLATRLGISHPFATEQARRFYQIASERNFTRGREIEKVTGACLYVACRANVVPYLLIDFAVELNVNVYELGAIYLDLCKVLSLEMHSFVRNCVDPSLFIHRYTCALLKRKDMKVTMAALRIVASMKRDWMQTGRKPGGICGAAVYIAANAHGFMCRKADVVKVVRVCEGTLVKRLVEFGNTESGGLTIDEFDTNAKEFDKEKSCLRKGSGDVEVLCKHKGEKAYCHGLCSVCYKEFVEISGGLNGGADPPAFKRAELERMIKGGGIEEIRLRENCRSKDQLGDDDDDDSENLSDVDDCEVDGYLNNEKEIEYKTVIWEAMNSEYLREQEEKRRDAGEANGKTRKKQTQKPNKKGKNEPVADTALEAARLEFSSKKRLRSLINFDALDKLFEGVETPNAKKSHTESCVEEQERSVDENEGDGFGNEDDDEEDLSNENDEYEGDIYDDNAEGVNGQHWITEDGEEGYDNINDDYDEY